MSDPAHRTSAAEQARAYVATLLAALGPREPLEVLRETPATLRHAAAGLSSQQLSMPEHGHDRVHLRQIARIRAAIGAPQPGD